MDLTRKINDKLYGLKLNTFEKRIHTTSIIFAILFSTATVIGHALYKTNDFAAAFCEKGSIARATGTFVVLLILTFLLTALAYSFISGKSKKIEAGKFTGFFAKKKGMLILWLVIFLSWIPCFLAYFPGILAYDIIGQNFQAELQQYTSHHPPLHTFIWQICIYLEGVTGVKRVSIYCISQMILLSYAVSKMISYMASKNASTLIIVLSLLFFAVNPVCAIVSCLPIKDVYCAIFFILLTLSVCDMISDTEGFFKSPLKQLAFVLRALLFCLFRNNAVYALAVAAVIFIVAFRKYIVKAAATFLIPLICYAFITGTVFEKLGIQKGSEVEALSVPLQQIAFVISKHGDEIPEDIQQDIKTFLPYDFTTIKEAYNPRFADYIKELADMNGGIKPVITVWARLFMQYPLDFISSGCTLNLPYWYIGSGATDEFSGRLFIETKLHVTDTMEDWLRLFPGALEYYESVAEYRGVVTLFPINLLCSTSLPIWTMLFFMIGCFVKKQKYAVIYVIPLLFWCTYLLGPVSAFRYLIPVYVQIPIMIGACTGMNLY